MEWNDFVAAGGVGHDTIRTTDSVGELGDAALVCIALDLGTDGEY